MPTSMSHRRARWIFLVAALAVAIAACAGPTSPPTAQPKAAQPAGQPAPDGAPQAASKPAAPATLLYGLQGGDIAYYWPLYVALEQGFFQAQAVEPDLISTRTTPDTTNMIVTQALHLAATTPSSAVLAREQDPTAPLAIVAGAMDKITATIVGTPSVRTLADVRGKTVGTGALRTTSTYLMRRLFRDRAGLIEDRDYDFVQIGSTADRVAALINGGIAASDMSQPRDFQLMDQGYHLLGSLAEMASDYMFLSVVANSQWASQNADTMTRFVRAWSQACQWLYDPANKARATEMLAARTNVDVPLATRIYESYIEKDKVFTRDGSINVAALKGIMDLMAEVGDLNPPVPDAAKFVDNRYYEAARARN
jgi:ABC-type nitrate/sulfonate/bicarbonate transport system substrate-binding protein